MQTEYQALAAANPQTKPIVLYYESSRRLLKAHFIIPRRVEGWVDIGGYIPGYITYIVRRRSLIPLLTGPDVDGYQHVTAKPRYSARCKNSPNCRLLWLFLVSATIADVYFRRRFQFLVTDNGKGEAEYSDIVISITTAAAAASCQSS